MSRHTAPIGCLLSSLPRPPPFHWRGGAAAERRAAGCFPLGSVQEEEEEEQREGGREIKEAGRSGTLVALYGKINCAASVAA